MPVLSSTDIEAVERFPCFGGRCAVLVQGSDPSGSAFEAAAQARRRLESWHRQFSRFDPGSELSRINRDPRETVPVTPTMVLLVKAALGAAVLTSGLVDPTLVDRIEQAGYANDLSPRTLSPKDVVRLAPRAAPGWPIRLDAGAK